MRPYSEDLRERAVRRAEAGETIRSIAEALQISPSCVSKWRRRLRETGALTPDQVGGHKPRRLAGECAEWLRARIAAGPFTTRGLTAELAARGIMCGRPLRDKGSDAGDEVWMRSCVRPVGAAMAAGPDEVRERAPNKLAASESR
jgi:transposase